MKENIVGQRIKTIREKRGMSVQDLASALPGNPEANVRLVENLESGDFAPSLTPLLQTARALGVRLGSFLDDQDGVSAVVTRKSELSRVARLSGSPRDPAHAGLVFHSLAAGKADRHMEPFLVDLPPHSGPEERSSHEGEEFIRVLTGTVVILHGTERHELAEGDSIYYDSIVPHLVHAGGETGATILAVVYAPF